MSQCYRPPSSFLHAFISFLSIMQRRNVLRKVTERQALSTHVTSQYHINITSHPPRPDLLPAPPPPPTPGRDATGTMFTTPRRLISRILSPCSPVRLSAPSISSCGLLARRPTEARRCSFLSPSPSFPCRGSRPPSSHPKVFTLLT